jgi:hypothetical protein
MPSEYQVERDAIATVQRASPVGSAEHEPAAFCLNA